MLLNIPYHESLYNAINLKVNSDFIKHADPEILIEIHRQIGGTVELVLENDMSAAKSDWYVVWDIYIAVDALYESKKITNKLYKKFIITLDKVLWKLYKEWYIQKGYHIDEN